MLYLTTGSLPFPLALLAIRHQEDVVSIAGRIVNKREQGKLLFYTIKADGAKVQVMSSLGEYADGEEAFWKMHGLLRRGDLIGVTGFAGKSKKGELSVFPTSILLLAPCLHMLPRMGLKSQEVRNTTLSCLELPPV